ncbi:MAG: hypothetical protein HQ556_08500 [Candidatus Marinimicrobia bacterium]|nr:hypothetical protein [Candidatus Neomarinimicrobiota bacterium]
MVTGSGWEIDFLPVGNGEKSGDAIALRYGEPGNYRILVYDGGIKESGENLVAHIKKYYGTDYVDDVVCSHPDADHASGLSIVLEELNVGRLWMHRPWAYSGLILDYFKDGRITSQSLEKRLKEKMSAAYKLEQIAIGQKIEVLEPFAGINIGNFTILSPAEDWYVKSLIADFEKSPERETGDPILDVLDRLLKQAAEKAISWVKESWGVESLKEDVQTTAENESSVVMLGYLAGEYVLLTGDAGIRALGNAVQYASMNGISLSSSLSFLQVPHHGSRNNVSPSILDALVGPIKQSDDGETNKVAFVSASKSSSKHPRKMVVNGFIRRGVKVCKTDGRPIRKDTNMPSRGWEPITPLSFSQDVEAWD